MASGIALRAVARNPSSWRQLFQMLTKVRQNITCVICRKIYNINNNCETCDLNIRNNPDTPIIECFQALCQFITALEIYPVMCRRHQDRELVELIREGLYSLG